jgi:hypothetical protein
MHPPIGSKQWNVNSRRRKNRAEAQAGGFDLEPGILCKDCYSINQEIHDISVIQFCRLSPNGITSGNFKAAEKTVRSCDPDHTILVICVLALPADIAI